VSTNQLPSSVVDKDHELEGRAERSSEALAKHRWHWTLDPNNPGKVSQREYARAVGRSQTTVSHYAQGHQLYVERLIGPANQQLSITDAIRLASQSVENRAMTEAIAAGLEQPVANVARGDNRQRRDIIVHAQDRAQRRGTDPVDEARNIAEHQRKFRESVSKQKAEKAKATSLRFIAIEGKLSSAKRYLIDALREAENVNLDGEEMELLRGTIGNLRALLNLLDARMAGEINVDWDAELAKLGGGS